MIALWTNHLSVANRTIDSSHKHIIGTINKVDSLIGTGDDATLIETFVVLEDSLCAYFETEEKIAKAIKVDFAQHKLAHQQLLNDFHCMRNMLAEKNGMRSEKEIANIIISWAKRFIQHIKDDGKQMKVVLSTHYYDFQPD
jgi:hemerythrin-like metal-binding protein